MKTLREKEIRILARRLNQIYDLQIAKTLSRAAQIEMYKELFAGLQQLFRIKSGFP